MLSNLNQKITYYLLIASDFINVNTLFDDNIETIEPLNLHPKSHERVYQSNLTKKKKQKPSDYRARRLFDSIDINQSY